MSQPTRYTGLVDQALAAIKAIESDVVQTVKFNLLQRSVGLWTKADDDLFSAHTAYATECWRAGFPELASVLWEEVLSKEADAADVVLSKRTPADRVHKGAPCYNAGLGYLLGGNLDKAIALISQAGVEEELRGNPGGIRLFVGDHGLTEKAILEPLDAALLVRWRSDYQAICKQPLDLKEFKQLVNWLSQPIENAVQLVASLTRLRILESVPVNSAVQHLKVQVLADAVLTIESSLRHWQSGQTGQLFERMKAMLAALPDALTAFNDAHGRFTTQYPNTDPATGQPNLNKETAAALNWAITDCLTNLAALPDGAKKAGTACYLAVRLRNSLMHVIDRSVDLYADKPKFERVTGIMLCVIRLSQAGNDGSIATL
jgi:hypothetical protein